MDILLLLIPLSVVLVLAIGAGFWWSVASGQFDDLDKASQSILFDDADTTPAQDEAPAQPPPASGDTERERT